MKKFQIFFIITLIMFALVCSHMASIRFFSIDSYLIDNKVQKCATKNFMSIDMNNCIEIGINSWEKEINQYYLMMKNELSEGNIPILDKAQNAWLSYYAQEKLFVQKVVAQKNGDIYTTVLLNNLYEIAKQRAIILKTFYEELKNNY